MGNEQPILVNPERWYAPELKATIITRLDDSRSGELKAYSWLLGVEIGI
jgi:hypothetical protein